MGSLWHVATCESSLSAAQHSHVCLIANSEIYECYLGDRLRVQLLSVHCWISITMGDHLRVGKPRSTQPSIPPGYINRVPACLTGVKVGCAHLCRVAGNTEMEFH